MCDSTSRSTLLACLLYYSSVAAEVRHHLVACRAAASNRRKMLCRTTSHDSSVGLSQQGPATVHANLYVDLGPAQPMLVLHAWYKGRNQSHGAAPGQCSSGCSHICVSPSPHSSRESRWCTVVEISLARRWPHRGTELGSGVIASLE